MTVQLDLFRPQPKPKGETIYNSYWFDLYGWFPKVGDVVSHDQCICLENLTGSNHYIMMMECTVLEINGNQSKVQPTDEWISSCFHANVKTDKDIYLVSTKALAPTKEAMSGI